jgi:hypothetical protein
MSDRDIVRALVEPVVSASVGLFAAWFVFPAPTGLAYLFACAVAVLFDGLAWDHGGLMWGQSEE